MKPELENAMPVPKDGTWVLLMLSDLLKALHLDETRPKTVTVRARGAEIQLDYEREGDRA